jgi:hypothetical protein
MHFLCNATLFFVKLGIKRVILNQQLQLRATKYGLKLILEKAPETT